MMVLVWDMDIIKNVLTPLNVNRYRLFKVDGVNLNDLHSPSIRCLLNVNGLFYKQSVKVLTVRLRPVNALTL
jgi:hypothetical protein